MISIISGLPGKGKNVLATHIGLKHFKRENNFVKLFIRRIKHQPLIINNVYSSYPILLNKNYKFKKNALIIIDEVQSFYDSDEFKDFPKEIAVFNQFHRHFDIKDIYYISQHPSRVVKKLRNVSCKFTKVRTFIVIPVIKIGIMYISNYYEFEDYGKWHHPSKEMKTYDVDNHFKIFNAKKVFDSYNSKYLSVLNKDKPFYDQGSYFSKTLSSSDISNIFGHDIL